MFTSRIGARVASAYVSFITIAALAQTPAPATPTTSTFVHYKPFFVNNPPADWRGANQLVEKLEGHLGHVRGGPKITQPKPAPSAGPNKSEAKKT